MSDPRVKPKDKPRRTNYGTPQWLFDVLDAEFHFTWDVCADANNHKCPGYWTEEDNAFRQDWTSVGNALFCNPPYGQELPKWLRRGKCTSGKYVNGRYITVVYIVPANTDTKWFHEICNWASQIRLLKGRVKFLLEDGTEDPRPMGGTAVVIFGPPYCSNPQGRIDYKPIRYNRKVSGYACLHCDFMAHMADEKDCNDGQCRSRAIGKMISHQNNRHRDKLGE